MSFTYEKNALGIFVTIKWGENNTPIPVPYGAPMTKISLVAHTEVDAVKQNIADYGVKAIGYIDNTNHHMGPWSAGSTAER